MSLLRNAKFRLSELHEDLQMWLAWHLPREIAYWAAVRLMAHASQQMPTCELDSITPADVLMAWRQD